MNINRIALLAPGLLFAALLRAHAQHINYAHEHLAACAYAWEKKDSARLQCGNREFCAAHKNDDRIGAIACDPYESKADRKQESILLSGAWLDAARDLKDMEPWTDCVASDGRPGHPCAMLAWTLRNLGPTGDILLPTGMKTAKLALRAHIGLDPFPVTVVRLGIGADRAGVMEVTWNHDGLGRRETHSTRLTPAELDRLLAAINRSDFWRLPYQGEHIINSGGEWAAVELSVAEHKKHVGDMIGDDEAADLSILVNQLSRMIKSRWPDAPA